MARALLQPHGTFASVANTFLKELFELVVGDSGEVFWKKWLSCVDGKEQLGSGASEYELFFAFMLKYHPEALRTRTLGYQEMADLDNVPENVDFVSFHWYLRPNTNSKTSLVSVSSSSTCTTATACSCVNPEEVEENEQNEGGCKKNKNNNKSARVICYVCIGVIAFLILLLICLNCMNLGTEPPSRHRHRHRHPPKQRRHLGQRRRK